MLLLHISCFYSAPHASAVYFMILGIVAYNTERGTSLWGPSFDEANLKWVQVLGSSFDGAHGLGAVLL